MEYKYFGFSHKLIVSKNNLFGSKLYYNKALNELETFEKNVYLRKFKNLWNEYTKNIKKSGNLDELNQLVKFLLKTKKEIRILDIGGGYGDNFYKFRRFNESKLSRIQYFILDENKKLSDLGKFFFSDDKNVFFKERLPEESISIVLLVGTLQYITDFIELLNNLKLESSCYFYFSRTVFSDLNKDFYSIQRLVDKNDIEQSIKIYSLSNFTNLMEKFKFKIAFKRENQLLNHLFLNKKKKKISYFDILFCRK